MIRPQSNNFLVRISFALKNGAGGRAETKKFGCFWKKKTCILPVGYLTCFAKYMLLKLPIYHQNKGEEVCLCSTISMYIYLCYLIFSVFVFICIYLHVNTDKYTNNYTQIHIQIHKQLSNVNKKRTHILFSLFIDTTDYLLYWHTQKRLISRKMNSVTKGSLSENP